MAVKCSVCGRSFKNSQGLSGHVRNIHGTTSSKTQNVPSAQSSKSIQKTEGEIAADVFRMLEKGMNTTDIVIKLKIPPHTVDKLFNAWLNMNDWNRDMLEDLKTAKLEISEIFCDECRKGHRLKTKLWKITTAIENKKPKVAWWECSCGNKLAVLKVYRIRS